MSCFLKKNVFDYHCALHDITWHQERGAHVLFINAFSLHMQVYIGFYINTCNVTCKM